MSMMIDLQVTPETTLADIMDAILKHYEDNPSHGVGCACLDGIQASLRRSTTYADIHERITDISLAKAQRALDGILYIVQSRRF